MKKKIKNKVRPFYRKGAFYFYNFNKLTFFNYKKPKQIVIVFNGIFPHGGLVDRLKGIISFYNIAEILGYEFKIYFTDPFNLNYFLEPNEINWIASKNDLSWNPLNTKVLYLMNDFKCNPLNIIKNHTKKKYIVFCNVDYLNTIYNENTTDENNEIWSKSFEKLFKKSNQLNNIINQLEIKDNYIAIHTRFTTILDDFDDSTNLKISEKRKLEIISKLHQKIDEIANKNSNKKIVVFSDSITFLNYIKSKTSYTIIDGLPLHIDSKSKKKENNEFIKTFIDFFAIANSDEVFLLKTKEMYNSAFSKYAAIVGKKKFNVIEI